MSRRAATVEAFRRDPIGAYTAGASWIHAALRDDLFAVVLFGCPVHEDMRALVASLEIELEADRPPHRSLVDASRIERVDLGAFEVLNAYVTANRARLSEQVTALSMVRPNGLEGAVVAGFFEVLESPYPVAVFDRPGEALRWLDAPSPDAALEVLGRIVSAERGAPPFSSALRAWLAAHLLDAEIRTASKALGVSSRTLQRRLELENTTFQQEVLRTRLAEAERRMLHSDASLTAIALDAGFGTLQSFSTAFRRVHGESASAWRAARRRV